jgi:hypothetical protein
LGVINIDEMIKRYKENWRNHLERKGGRLPSATGSLLPTEEDQKIMQRPNLNDS